MIARALGLLVTCHVVLCHPGPKPYPGPNPYPAARPNAGAAPAPAPQYGFGGYGGYGGCGCGCGCPIVEEVITPPVIPPVLNTVDVYDIATLGVIPAPPIEYVYPAVGYEAFGLGCNGGFGYY